MRKLYLRIYLAVLASLAAFALASGVLWRQLSDTGPLGHAFEVAGTLAQNVLAPAAAPKPEQQAALERFVANSRADVALFSDDRTLLAWVGEPLPPPYTDRDRSGWLRHWGGPPAWTIRMPDGRWLVARVRHDHWHPGFGLFLLLALLALAVGVGAYPVVRRLTARIEELVGAHKVLLANASHELRTPLARIRMAVELMKENADPKRKRDLGLDIAELDTLIDEILLASRLEVVKGLDVDEEVDLLALASEECARYEEVELGGQPVSVRGDPRLLRRMIRNLLENARRHGAPPIEVSVCRTEGGAELRVCDHGPGIAEAEREGVFRPFHRFEGARASAGAGLGLALVRQIARRHGGDARYLGREQRRSCFAVSLVMSPHVPS